MSAADRIARLKVELAAGHPVTGPYNADHELAADQINAVDRTRTKASMTGDELFGATVATEYAALTDHRQQQWLAFCARATIDPGGAANVAFVKHIFTAAAVTVSALATLRTVAISRADELGLQRIRAGTVAEARAS